MRRTRPSIGTPGVRVLAALLGAASAVAGGLLLFRPLTALVVLVAGAAVALVAGGALLVSRGPRQPWRWIAAALLLVAAAVAGASVPVVVRALPIALIVLLVANAGRLVVRAIRERSAGPRLILVVSVIANLLSAVVPWAWPDAAVIVIAALFSLLLLAAGCLLVVGAIRGRLGRRAGDPRRRRHPVLHGVAASLALVLASAAAFGTVQLLAGTAQADDFYAWDDDIPATPGEVLRTASYAGELPDGAEALRVLYSTSYSDGSPAVASAVVAYPTGDADQPRTVLAWQHGTTGVARSCAPSAGTEALSEYAIPGISRAIDRGWVVVATDYPGQGTDGRYPYLIGQGEGRAALDGIRALQQIDDARASNEVWVWGHSQGGHASLWAGQIADDYAPDIDILGVAALSAAADPLALAERITGAETSALGEIITSLVLIPYADEYADVDLASSVHPAGHGIVEAFASRCIAEPPTLVSVLVGSAIDVDAPLYRIDVTEGPTHDRLSENIADGIVSSPLFLGQGVEDEVIPIDMQRRLGAALCAAGRTVETHEYAGRTHMGVIAEGAPLIDDLYTWADAVTAGQSPSSC